MYLLFGTPAETGESARRTLDFTVANSRHIDFLNLAIFNMPVNAADAASLATGAFYDGDLALYTGFEHPHGWGRGQVRRFLDREFKRHPAIAPILGATRRFLPQTTHRFLSGREPATSLIP